MNFGKIKLLILDVDGVLTDGTKAYNCKGEVVSKTFNDKDFTAIKRFVEAGVTVVWLSGDENVNKDIASRRNIPFYNSKAFGVLSKKEFVPRFEKRYNCKPEEMAYIGDDYFDIDILKLVGFPLRTSDSVIDLMQYARKIDCKGGQGVVAHLFDIYKSWTGHETNDAKLREIDSKER